MVIYPLLIWVDVSYLLLNGVHLAALFCREHSIIIAILG